MIHLIHLSYSPYNFSILFPIALICLFDEPLQMTKYEQGELEIFFKFIITMSLPFFSLIELMIKFMFLFFSIELILNLF